jgi:ribosomal protein S18 acetylase RimI-like enzyme
MALEPGSSLPAQTSPVFPDPQYLVKPFLNPAVHEGLGATYSGSGILGVANVDTFGDLIPPRSLDPFRDGAFGWVKREQMAYISNVAVARSARRRGVATLVMAEAEALAREWGCRSAALHCNPNNTPAWELYTRLGYRKTVQEPPWMPILNQRPGDRCFLMVKRLAAV